MYNELIENINIDLYRILYVVKKNGSFSKAAEELNTTQPAISYKIKKLEEKLGLKIFVRDTRPLQLIPEAKVIISTNFVLRKFAEQFLSYKKILRNIFLNKIFKF